MRIPLDDGLWKRLYGPYGNRSVNGMLEKLAAGWDDKLAEDLFWEELHHQDSVYPATYAALPWLIAIAPKDGKGHEETQLFLSHIVYCACASFQPAEACRENVTFRGLSMKAADHHHAWLQEEERLTEADMAVLAGVEQWFVRNVEKIATDCLQLVGDDLGISAYALEGFAALRGGDRVADATRMFAFGEEPDFIESEIGRFDETDSSVVAALYPHLRGRSDTIADFLLNFPGCTFVPADPGQGDMFKA